LFECTNPTKQTDAQAPSTPQKAFNLVVLAMQRGDIAAIERLTTQDGIESMRFNTRAAVAGGQDSITVFKNLDKTWASWELRWQPVEGDRALLHMGPEIKQHSLAFVHTASGWKLDRWTPGR